MTIAPSWDALLAQCRREGIVVNRAHLDCRLGCWSASARMIWVDSALSDRHAAPTLAHELMHVRRGDVGPMPARVEQEIDEEVSVGFVDPREYARAERIRGPYAACIADEMDLPQWVVEAWQRRRLRVA